MQKARQAKKQRPPRQCSEWTVQLFDKLEEPEDRYLSLSESIETDDDDSSDRPPSGDIT
mgnify:CR=1 FL=1